MHGKSRTPRVLKFVLSTAAESIQNALLTPYSNSCTAQHAIVEINITNGTSLM